MRFGMEQADEDELLFYFAQREAPNPSERATRSRWQSLNAFFNGADRQMEAQLRQFYSTGLLNWAQSTRTATRTHAELYPEPSPGLSRFPGSIRREPGVAGLEERRSKPPTLRAWLEDLYGRQTGGSATPRELLTVDMIEHEVTDALKHLVQAFQRQRAAHDRSLVKEERRRGEERQRPLAQRPVSGQGLSARNPRKKGEPPPPEIIVLRKRPKA